ncbi:uncharacterized protein LOC117172646 [Belonocnema kinseyi]|uniref:uncharacterized protein LOC117172646 n=1 Tax=Belonocnema kinseyi TaxID=2817044 RepID=UPI00143DFF18|nr:uncharacterized protein LOC117172646 [Belonocnema kinseyi]
MNSFEPFLDGPFNKLWKGLDDIQSFPQCAKFELRAADCLEAYGKDHWGKKCQDYVEDLRECIFRSKQNMRVRLMRLERQRQWRAGERETYYAPGPPEDAY